jgi:predicted RNase H-like HicB family nuclease/predicted RNA binding protein YcfA (HicA-like mRNA interferase family)
MKAREVIRLIEADGWCLVATRGSHRQFKHPRKPGRVTVPGLKQAEPEGGMLMRFAIVIERAESNYSAYVPDLPGCVATGTTVEEVERQIRDAIRLHIDGLRADGLPVPCQPASRNMWRRKPI